MNVSLTLSNFKTHVSKEIEFPDKGLVLLSGVSGAGKSSVFKAVLQALYGCVSKPQNWNASNYEVSLNIRGHQIKRAKGKNAVKFNGIDGELAQAEIERFLGMNEAEFISSSYIAQKNQQSLLTLTPAEQLNFIERLAFSGESPDKYKTRILSKINNTKNELASADNEVKSLISIEQELKSSLPKDAPLIDWDGPIMIREKELSITAGELNKAQETYYTFVEKRKEQQDRLNLLLEIDTKIKQGKISLGEIRAQLDALEKDYKELPSIPQESDIANLKEARRLNDIVLKIEETRQKIEKLREGTGTESAVDEKITDTKTSINAIKARIIAASKELQSANISVETQDKYQKYLAENGFLKVTNPSLIYSKEAVELLKNRVLLAEESILKTEKAISDTKQSQVFGTSKKCPKCKTDLILDSGQLCVHSRSNEDSFSTVIQSLESQKNKYRAAQEKIRKSIAEIEKIVSPLGEDLVDAECLFGRRDALESTLSSLNYELEHLSKTLDTLNSQKTVIAEKKKQTEELLSLENSLQVTANVTCKGNPKLLDLIKKYEGCSFDSVIEETLLLFNSANSSCKRINELKQQQSEAESYVLRLIKERDEIAEKPSIVPTMLTFEEITENVNELKDNINLIKQQLIEYKAKRDQQKKDIDSRERVSNTYKSVLVKLESAKNIQESSLKTLKNATKLKEISDIAQTQAIESTVESINVAAQEYLNCLFADFPLTAQLRTTKENKDGSVKPKLSLIINYKGVEFNSIDEVSGGEYDRIVLAFQLALNSMYASPFLMIDEGFTGLNSELVDLTVDSLRILSRESLVIVIGHNVNAGMFDEVVEI